MCKTWEGDFMRFSFFFLHINIQIQIGPSIQTTTEV